MKKFLYMLSILGLILGIASPLPIWPGPLFLRHLLPGIISAVLMISACLGAMKKGSKVVGVIAIIYGALASLAGVIFMFVMVTATSEEFLTVMKYLGGIVIAGSIVTLLIGIITIILGYKVFKAVKKST